MTVLKWVVCSQISLDSAFLESLQIMDYSLLMGLHFRAPEHLKSLLEHPDSLHYPKRTNDTSVDGRYSILTGKNLGWLSCYGDAKLKLHVKIWNRGAYRTGNI